MKNKLQVGILVATVAFAVAGQAAEAQLHRVMQGGKVGFIDSAGKLVIPATLPDTAGKFFSEGLLPVMKSSGWEYIDETGQTRIKLGERYVQAFDFSEGLASADDGNSMGFIDKQGNEVIRPQFRLAFDFKEGFASVSKVEGGSMFVDKTGKQAFTRFAPGMEGFSEGLASVAMAADKTMIKRQGYIDHAGQLVVPCEYTRAEPCSEGILIVAREREWLGLDTNGAVKISGSFQTLRPFSEGLAAAKIDGSWGFIDKTGKLAIPAKYENCWRFSEGLAGVKLNGKWGFIDKTGKQVIEPRFTLSKDWETMKGRIPQFRGGLAQMPEGTKAGYIDKTGAWVWPPSE